MEINSERYCEGNFKQISRMLQMVMSEGPLPVTPNIEGGAGCGKSALALGLADAKTAIVWISPASQISEPGDLAGYPHIKGDVTVYSPPEWAVRANELATQYARVLLIMDDYNRVPAQIQQAFMPMFYERRVGGYELAPNVFIILTSNPSNSDRYATRDLDIAQAERIQTFRLIYDHDIFIQHAMRKQWTPEWVAFLSEYPEHMGLDGTGISPRTAEFCHQAIKNFKENYNVSLKDELMHLRIDAVVGQAVRASFIQCVELQGMIITPENIMQGKWTKDQYNRIVDGRPDLLGLTHSRLAAALHKRSNEKKDVTEREYENMRKFILGHSNDELTLVFLRSCPPEIGNEVLSVTTMREIRDRVFGTD